jgi:3-isopropylmalate/(R)-2-methylmalate dehydratase small subunit
MEGIDAGFPKKAEKGIIIIGGKNFGCGSSREQAPLALKYAGVQCVLAESFARIFYRNSINIGLPVIECKGISEAVADGDEVSVDLEAGKIQNLAKKKNLQGTKMPPFIMEILSDGGLIENLRKRMNKK